MWLLYIWSRCRGNSGSKEKREENFGKWDVVEVIGVEVDFMAIICEAGGPLRILSLWQRISTRGAIGRESFVGVRRGFAEARLGG